MNTLISISFYRNQGDYDSLAVLEQNGQYFVVCSHASHGYGNLPEVQFPPNLDTAVIIGSQFMKQFHPTIYHGYPLTKEGIVQIKADALDHGWEVKADNSFKTALIATGIPQEAFETIKS